MVVWCWCFGGLVVWWFGMTSPSSDEFLRMGFFFGGVSSSEGRTSISPRPVTTAPSCSSQDSRHDLPPPTALSFSSRNSRNAASPPTAPSSWSWRSPRAAMMMHTKWRREVASLLPKEPTEESYPRRHLGNRQANRSLFGGAWRDGRTGFFFGRRKPNRGSKKREAVFS